MVFLLQCIERMPDSLNAALVMIQIAKKRKLYLRVFFFFLIYRL